MSWIKTSPSNLALIKYMGKKEASKNTPLNASLSYTLNHFITKVKIQKSEEKKDEWCPFDVPPFFYTEGVVYEQSFPEFVSKEKDLFKKCYRSSSEIQFEKSLSSQNQKKFLDFFQILKKEFKIEGFYKISSANNFPLSAGAASSASSFSALTLTAWELAKENSSQPDFIEGLTKEELSKISRRGSGSSCRSLFSPWALWKEECAIPFECPFKHLLHQLIVVDLSVKKVSSREAHLRVLKSPQFKGRLERAEKRLGDLCQSLNVQDWKKCFEISWDEFLDMHHLFETSVPSFKYRNEKSQVVLDKLKKIWDEEQDGPLVTMDAGANIHLLYREDQKKRMEEIEQLLPECLILSSDV